MSTFRRRCGKRAWNGRWRASAVTCKAAHITYALPVPESRFPPYDKTPRFTPVATPLPLLSISRSWGSHCVEPSSPPRFHGFTLRLLRDRLVRRRRGRLANERTRFRGRLCPGGRRGGGRGVRVPAAGVRQGTARGDGPPVRSAPVPLLQVAGGLATERRGVGVRPLAEEPGRRDQDLAVFDRQEGEPLYPKSLALCDLGFQYPMGNCSFSFLLEGFLGIFTRT